MPGQCTTRERTMLQFGLGVVTEEITGGVGTGAEVVPALQFGLGVVTEEILLLVA